MVRDLTGQTYFKQRFGPLFSKRRGEMREGGTVTSKAVNSFVLANAMLFLIVTLAGYWWTYFALWTVAMATWFPLVTRLRNVAEHAVVNTTDDPFTHARTTHANVLERLFIAPYWVHYHAEHHVFMHVPCYNLPKAHRMLIQKGYGERMQIADGYFAVLRQAAPA